MKRRDHYRGAVAEQYESKRRGMLWEREQRAVRDLVATWGPHESVIDVPVGTGRFLKLYGDDREVVGVDVSPDMLVEAHKKDTAAELEVGDIFDLGYPDGEFDHAVCFRLLNWMDLTEAGRALRELRRVARTLHVSVTTLTGEPRRKVARIIHEPDAWNQTVADAGLEVLNVQVLRENRGHRYQVVTLR